MTHKTYKIRIRSSTKNALDLGGIINEEEKHSCIITDNPDDRKHDSGNSGAMLRRQRLRSPMRPKLCRCQWGWSL